MNNKLWAPGILVVILVLTGTAIYQFNQNRLDNDIIERRDEIRDETVVPTQTINTNHQYRDGEHVFVGTITLPTPCHSFNAEAVELENETEIRITTDSSDEMCAQVLTDRQFRVSFQASEDQPVIATVNGELVNLNIFEVPSDQNIEDMEVFIKG